MLEKLGNQTINAVFFRLCELFQVGVLVGSLYYVLERENLSSRCPLPPWPGRFIMLVGKIIFRLNTLTTLAGSNYYVLVRENLSSRCPSPPWPGRTTMFLCERICRHDVPYHPGRIVLLCSCAKEFVVMMSLTTLAGSYYYVIVRENFSSQCPLLHPQIYLNCHFEKIQSYLNIHVSS